MNASRVASFEVLVSWYQIIVHDDLYSGYNAWTPEHVMQGFAWRPGSVSFGTLDIVDMEVVVNLEENPVLMLDSQRAIVVPFVVKRDSQIFVVSSLTRVPVPIPSGTYELWFQHGRPEGMRTMWCTLAFKPESKPRAAILRADHELCPPGTLMLDAEPA